MSLIRWNPSHDLMPLTGDLLGMQRDINRMFDTFFRGGMSDEGDQFRGAWAPAIDLAEYDREYQVRVELPGVNKEDVKITMQGNILTIRGEKKPDGEQEPTQMYRSERWFGAFQRSFTLPTSVRNDKIEANYRDGILTISLPKAEEAIPKSIEVKLK